MENNFPETWDLLPLEDCMEAIIDYRGKTPHKSSFGIPLITAKIVKGGRILEPTEFIPYEDYDERMQRGIPNAGDIVVTTEAPLGEVGQLDNRKLSVGQRLITLRGKSDLLDNTYLKFLMMSDFVQNQLLARATGTTVIGIKQTELRKIDLVVPPLPEQRAIAGILGALDDKIEVNRRMNVTLESMARAVFRQWFVENEEIGDWEIVPLPEIIEVNPSRSLKKGEIAPYLDMANMPTQGHRGIEWIDRTFGSGTKFINGDTLLARITPCLENGKTGFVDFLKDNQVGWGSTEYIIFHPKPPLPPEYGYYLARSEELRSHAIQNMTGTSGRQRTPASCFDSFMISKPPEELARKFGEFAGSVIEKVRANDEESRTLGSLRDSLLPKLMRGEVRVIVN